MPFLRYTTAAQKPHRPPPPLLFAAGSSDQTKFVKASGTSAACDWVAMNQQNTLCLAAAEETLGRTEDCRISAWNIFFLFFFFGNFNCKGTVPPSFLPYFFFSFLFCFYGGLNCKLSNSFMILLFVH